jgi:hypothetical protein
MFNALSSILRGEIEALNVIPEGEVVHHHAHKSHVEYDNSDSDAGRCHK